jgi:hypothetical protein
LRCRNRDSLLPFWKRKILLSERTKSLPCNHRMFRQPGFLTRLATSVRKCNHSGECVSEDEGVEKGREPSHPPSVASVPATGISSVGKTTASICLAILLYGMCFVVFFSCALHPPLSGLLLACALPGTAGV